MKKKTLLISFIIALSTVIVLSIAYEIYVYLWSLSLPEADPIIRVDIFIVYPVIVIFSTVVFFIAKIILGRKK